MRRWSACAGLPARCAAALPDEAKAIACLMNVTSRPDVDRFISLWRESGDVVHSTDKGICDHPPHMVVPSQPQLPRFYSGHIYTQHRLISHLRQLWSDDTPRIMIDVCDRYRSAEGLCLSWPRFCCQCVRARSVLLPMRQSAHAPILFLAGWLPVWQRDLLQLERYADLAPVVQSHWWARRWH